MPRTTGTAIWDSANVANYKASGQALSDAMKAVLTQTTDTGQVVWANVTALPAANAVRDYEVYRFTDALQATKPIFIRVDYMISTTMRHRITVGTGTDGAGNITGTSTGRLDLFDNTSAAIGTSTANHHYTTARPYFASSDGSYLTLLWGVLTTGTAPDTQTSAWAIDRTRNADGTANGEGFTVWWFVQGEYGGMVQRYTNGNAQPPAPEYHIYSIVPTPAQSSAFSGDTAYAFPVHSYAPAVQGASQAWLFGIGGDWPRFTEVTIPHYGVNATWLPFGNGGLLRYPYMSARTNATLNTTYSPIIRY